MANLKLQKISLNQFFTELYSCSSITYILSNTIQGDNAYEYHILLEKFSCKLNKKIGSIQKVWQGINEKIADIDMLPAMTIPKKDDIIQYFQILIKFIQDNWKNVLGDDDIIEDEVLELLAHLTRTLQMIIRLKK